MFRTILVMIFVVIYLVLSLPFLGIMAIIRKYHPEKAEMVVLRVVQWVFKVILFLCGTKITVKGYENVPENEAVLYIGNHQSFFDVIISYSLMKNRTGYIAKDGIKKVPLLRLNMMFLHCLFLNRSDLKQGLETILKAIEYIKDGVSMFIFPEGTRNKDDETELAEFHRGSFKIAQRTNCKIIPISFNNTAAIFEKQFPRAKSRHVIVEFGTPVRYKDIPKEDQKQIDEYFRKMLTDMILKNQAEI